MVAGFDELTGESRQREDAARSDEHEDLDGVDDRADGVPQFRLNLIARRAEGRRRVERCRR